MELQQLERELEDERKIRDAIFQVNNCLEKKIRDLKREIVHSKKEDPVNGATETDGYRRLQEQLQYNHKLEKDVELEKERLRILSERNTDITNMDLDILSQTELIRLVKQLERIRTDVQSTLREIEVNLDKTNNEYLRLHETKNLYKAEINLRERKRRQTISQQLNTTR